MRRKVIQGSECFHDRRGCSVLVVVRVKNGTLHIELACRCGWTHHYSQTLEDGECVELDGCALSAEKFSHRPSKSPGIGTTGASL